jgi:hypothetical protein
VDDEVAMLRISLRDLSEQLARCDVDNPKGVIEVEDAYQNGIIWGLHYGQYHEKLSHLEPSSFCERVIEIAEKQVGVNPRPAVQTDYPKTVGIGQHEVTPALIFESSAQAAVYLWGRELLPFSRVKLLGALNEAFARATEK